MALLKGLLTPMIGAMVNYVNAPHLARERGIRVVEARSSTTDGFSNLIRLTVSGVGGERSVSGALFGENDYRIVGSTTTTWRRFPTATFSFFTTRTGPGSSGLSAGYSAKPGINIAMMNLSRRKIKGKAVSLINVDSRIPEKVLEKLRANEHILSAVQVHL